MAAALRKKLTLLQEEIAEEQSENAKLKESLKKATALAKDAQDELRELSDTITDEKKLIDETNSALSVRL